MRWNLKGCYQQCGQWNHLSANLLGYWWKISFLIQTCKSKSVTSSWYVSQLQSFCVFLSRLWNISTAASAFRFEINHLRRIATFTELLRSPLKTVEPGVCLQSACPTESGNIKKKGGPMYSFSYCKRKYIEWFVIFVKFWSL